MAVQKTSGRFPPEIDLSKYIQKGEDEHGSDSHGHVRPLPFEQLRGVGLRRLSKKWRSLAESLNQALDGDFGWELQAI